MQALEIIVGVAGVLGFVLSLFLAIYGAVRNRESYKVSLIDYADQWNTTQFMLAIVNKSRTPLVITEISHDGTTCELVPKKIRGEPYDWNALTTPRFPVCVPALEAQVVCIEFVHKQHIPLSPGKEVTLQIQTTFHRGHKTLLLGTRSHYLNTRV